MNMKDLQEVISGKKKEYFEKIENFCKEDEIKKFKTVTIDFNEISDEEKLKTKINDDNCGIYIFFCDNNVKDIIKEFYPKKRENQDKYKMLSKYQDEYKMLSRYNKENFEDNDKENSPYCLYVGSSKELKSRLRQHCDDNLNGPYAMHIGSWKNWSHLKEQKEQKELKVLEVLKELKDGQIEIFILKLENKKEYFPEQIQFYEDVLWDYYKPLLGRRGPK